MTKVSYRSKKLFRLMVLEGESIILETTWKKAEDMVAEAGKLRTHIFNLKQEVKSETTTSL